MMRLKYVWLLLALGVLAVSAAAAPLTGHDLQSLSWESLTKKAESLVGTARSALSAALDSSPTAKGRGGAPAQGPALSVTVSQPIERTVVEWDEYTGRFDAIDVVDIRARVSGYLTEVHFTDGQYVKVGDLLYVIDPRPFERALDLARAELDQAKVRVDNANLDVVRGRPLAERKVISEKTQDDRENLLRDAESAVKVAEARVKSAELDLSFTRIMAPISGRIGRSLVTAGNFVSSGGSISTTSLATIVSQDPIYIYFDVSENNYIKYKRLAQSGHQAGASELGAAVEIALPDEKGFPRQGRLNFLDNRLDGSTGTLRTRAVVDNKSGLFSPNLFARVRVTSSAPYTALLLPDEAIGTDQVNRFVYVVGDDGVPQRRPVDLGSLSDGLRVVRDGIKAGDWVIVKGIQRVRPGVAVAAKREALNVSQAVQPETGIPLRTR